MLLNYKTFLTFLALMVAKCLTSTAADPPFLNYINDGWVNEQLEGFSTEEKIAQLMMITVYPRQNDARKR